MTNLPEVSEQSRAVALPLAFMLGVFGAHRFYVGRTGSGVLMLCTLGGMGLWWMYDLILVVAGEFRDAEGRRVLRWSSGDSSYPSQLGAGGPAVLSEEMDVLRGEVAELAERVDFMERLLTQARDRGVIPPGRT